MHDAKTATTATIEAIEAEQLRKYRTFYNAEKLDITRREASDYFAQFVQLRLNRVRQHYQGGAILDLCCGSGDYLVPVAQFADAIVGLDFSPELIAAAREKIAQQNLRNTTLEVANAKALPLKDNGIALVFCFASLYHIPGVEPVIQECFRVLRPGGVAILEFGVSHSLNTLVCESAPDSAMPCHLPLKEIQRIVRDSGLEVISDEPYQILPLWGKKPKWLRPLLHPMWKKMMSLTLGGKMLDAHLSAIWPLSHFAFRRVIVCRKPA